MTASQNVQTKLLIVEDQPTILDKQRRLLEGYPRELAIVGAARDGATALRLIDELEPDVVLLDLGLPDLDGIEITRRVKASHPEVEILIFTIFDEEARVLEAVRAGASGYLLKGTPAQRIVEAIAEVRRGGSVIQPQLARRLLRHFQDAARSPEAPTLTPRETEILHLIARGLSNRAAAEALDLSRATVRTHLEHIYAKLDVSNRTEAVTEAIRRGLIEP
jgi:DNA-binding NarL/FixJ family response regulator